MNFDKEEIMAVKDTKPTEIFLIISGEVQNEYTQRVFGKGHYIGADDILFGRKRVNTYRAVNAVKTKRLAREDFEVMCKEYPEIKKHCLAEANFRGLVLRFDQNLKEAIYS
jgi:CRP-like cAMP-binding protein